MKKILLILIFYFLSINPTECENDKGCSENFICVDGFCRSQCNDATDCPPGNFRMYYTCETYQGKKYCKPIGIF